MSDAELSIIVLTRDEEANLPHLIASLEGLPVRLFVVDSGSVDRTRAIALAAGAVVVEHPFETQAQQLNWALAALPIETPWVMRLDADERLTAGLAAELRTRLAGLPPEVTGLMVKRQVWFWGRWIRYGGYYPVWLLRIWRRGEADCEQRWMDEHMLLRSGSALRLEHDIIDENHKGLGAWIDKHNRYASREVLDILHSRTKSEDISDLDDKSKKKRWLKNNLYNKGPLFFRAFLYWLVRYVLQLGFLDGRPGLVFHFLQACWYRFLVDAKLYEAGRSAALDGDRTALPLDRKPHSR